MNTKLAKEIAQELGVEDWEPGDLQREVLRLTIENTKLKDENAALKRQAVEPWNNRLPNKPGEYRIINTKTGEQQNTVMSWENSILRDKLICAVRDVWAGTSKYVSASELLERGYFFSYLPVTFADDTYPCT
jgi:hypothetical protein